MNHRQLPLVAAVAVACLAVPAGAALAQAAAPDQQPTNAAAANAAQAPAEPASPAAAQPPQAASDQPPAAAPAQAAAAEAPTAPALSGPLVTYVKRTKPPFMVDTTIAAAELGMIGALASISSGHEIVTKNDVADPSTEIARSLAIAYAASQSGHVADAPISDDQLSSKTRPDNIGQVAGGARYVVSAAPANMDMIYFVTDPLRRDITLMTAAEIIDTSTGKVVAKGRCFIKQSKEGERFTHDQMLADGAAALKTVIVRKSQACVEKMEAEMKIAPPPAAGATSAPTS